jgi:hypothetical protein
VQRAEGRYSISATSRQSAAEAEARAAAIAGGRGAEAASSWSARALSETAAPNTLRGPVNSSRARSSVWMGALSAHAFKAAPSAMNDDRTANGDRAPTDARSSATPGRRHAS